MDFLRYLFSKKITNGNTQGNEIPLTADNPTTTYTVLKAGKLLFKCPTCPNTVSVTLQKIDPIIGVNVACSGCKNISHVPGGLIAEPTPPGMRITGGGRVPIAQFSKWYYENPLITSVIQRGQSDLLSDYGLWAFCGACYHQFPAIVLTFLAISQSMAQRTSDGFMFTGHTPDSEKDMDALRSGHCSHCMHKNLIVIAADIPDNVRNAILESKENNTSITANKVLKQKGDFPGGINTIVIITIVAIGIIIAFLFWGRGKLPDLSTIPTLESQTVFPISMSTSTPSESTLVPPSPQNQSGGICWTYELKNFDGNRSQAWDEVLSDKTKKKLQYYQFIVDVVLHNPQLKDDGYVFYGRKTYILPELCP